MSQQYQHVINFIKQVREVELPNNFTPLTSQNKFDRYHYMLEELQEFLAAEKAHDEIDAIIDLCYFAYGALAEMGINKNQFEAIFNRVHEANMLKKAGKKEGRNVNGTDAYKPEGWQEPNFDDILK